jgi:hypothetical protein
MGDAEEWLTTLLAVEEVFPTSNSADAAVFAMVVLLVNIIVEELARPAEVLPHADSAVAAHLRNLKNRKEKITKKYESPEFIEKILGLPLQR